MIYLDNAATTWPKPDRVYAAMEQCMREAGANPGRGGHRMALAAGRIIYEAREALGELFGIDNPHQIIFALNATDAINMALFGIVRPGDHVITTSMEHNAVARPLRVLEERGTELAVVQCDARGGLDPGDVQAAIKANTRLIVVSHASNVTGTIMPVAELGAIARDHGVLFMVDAAQTAGVLPLDVTALNIDLLAFTGHKGLYGPQGTGGLYVREDIALAPWRFGGTGSYSESDRQPDIVPDKYESGTPNTVGIAGLGAGVRFVLDTGLVRIRAHERALTQQLLDGLAEIPGITLYGPQDPSRQVAVVSFNIGEADSGQVSYLLDREFDIATRAGLHCAPWAHRTIGTLKQGTVRLSMGYFNTPGQITEVIKTIANIAAKLL